MSQVWYVTDDNLYYRLWHILHAGIGGGLSLHNEYDRRDVIGFTNSTNKHTFQRLQIYALPIFQKKTSGTSPRTKKQIITFARLSTK